MIRSRGGALGRVVRSGVGRRLVQSLVILLATMVAVASAVVAGSLMVAADAPFDHAFAQQHGAHLTAEFDPAKVTAAQLESTAKVDGVTTSAGPYPTVTIRPTDSDGIRLPTLTLVGRSEPRAGVDNLDLKSGRWPTRPGEIVLTTALRGPATELGAALKTSDAADSPTLTIVGVALSVGRTAEAWATPEQVATMAAAGNPSTLQMLYRFASADTADDIAAGRDRLVAALPPDALMGGESYLDTKHAADGGAAPTIPFLMAFGVLGIAMSVIIVGSVVSGAVGSGLRRIGILKAIGFTPREVVRAYMAQALIPACIGIGLGVVLGNLMALPLLDDTEEAFGDTSLAVAWWVDVLVVAVALLTVGIAALVPALRAGRLRTVEAIAVGRAPRTGRGQWAHRAVGRLPLPRAVTYGLASPFAHPVRTAATLLAVAFGTVAATFAVGLTASLNAVAAAQDPENNTAITVVSAPLVEAEPPEPGGPGERIERNVPLPPPALDPAPVRAAIDAQPGTASHYGLARAEVTVAGIAGPINAAFYQGDSSPGAYEMISGHWLDGPEQAVVSTRFLERTGTRIGDTVNVTSEGDTRTLRIVGEAFDTSNDGMRLHAELADLAGFAGFGTDRPDTFHINVRPGTSVAAYAAQLADTLRPLGSEVIVNSPSESEGMINVLTAMAALLTLMLVSVASLGVLNSVVLDTRERVHDIGVCKAIGMTPRQTVSMVLASVVGIGVLGALIGVPAGFALHGLVLPLMGDAVGTNLPPSILDVYDPTRLILLGLAGIVMALLGAMLPAGWAAKTRTATALRTE